MSVRAAIRYAKAVLAIANDNNSIDTIASDLATIAATIADSKELKEALVSPVVPSTVKKTALLEIFKGLDKGTINLIDTLIANKRIDILADVAKSYKQLYDTQRGYEVAVVTTAVPLSGELETKVLAKVKELTGKNVEIKNIVDETVIGGFILRVGDQQYNASIANQLNTLKRQFTLN